MILEQLCEYLVSIASEDLREAIIVGELPSLATEGIALNSPGHAPSAEFFGGDTPTPGDTIFKPLARFVLRASTYPQGSSWGEALRKTFHRYHDEEILSMTQVGTIMYLGRNPENMYEFQLTFTIQLRSE